MGWGGPPHHSRILADLAQAKAHSQSRRKDAVVSVAPPEAGTGCSRPPGNPCGAHHCKKGRIVSITTCSTQFANGRIVYTPRPSAFPASYCKSLQVRRPYKIVLGILFPTCSPTQNVAHRCWTSVFLKGEILVPPGSLTPLQGFYPYRILFWSSLRGNSG